MSRPLRIAMFVGSFPVLSETFILRQITGLLDRGHEVHIYATRGRNGRARSSEVAGLSAAGADDVHGPAAGNRALGDARLAHHWPQLAARLKDLCSQLRARDAGIAEIVNLSGEGAAADVKVPQSG